MSAGARLAGSALFASTMAFFEAAVAVYLWRLWELGEIDVARLTLENRFVLAEVVREAASLGMIVSVACLAGRGGMDRFAHAALIFGIWDILYYVSLRFLTGWPSSLLDWDVLFLIPKPWVSPVLAPLLVSAALVTGGLITVLRETGSRPVRAGALAWIAGVSGGLLVIASFLTPDPPSSPDKDPTGFPWPLFALGLSVAVAGLVWTLSMARRPEAARATSAPAPGGEPDKIQGEL